MIPIRLTQIRVDVRVSAAQKVARREPAERYALFAAALLPSNTVYYLSERAKPLLERYAAHNQRSAA